MIELLLCGCRMEHTPSGRVLAVDTCSWCVSLGLINVQARILQEKYVRGREAREAGAVVNSVLAKRDSSFILQ